MKFEKLKKNYTKNVIIGLIVIIIIGSVLVLNITKAKYRTTTSINIVNGTVNYSLADFNLISLYKQKVNSDGKPQEGFDKINNISELGDDAIYKIDEEQTKCYVSGSELIGNDKVNVTMTMNNASLSFSNVKKQGTKCNVYFAATKKPPTSEQVLANLRRNSTNSPSTFTEVDTAEHLNNGKTQMFRGTDDFGTTYYFRGKVKDNWVQFGNEGGTLGTGNNLYWRIVRINGDGSLRLIYAGSGADATSLTTDGGYTGNLTSSEISIRSVWAIDIKKFNNNMYVGYEWLENYMHGYGATPAQTTQSMVLKNLNSWFSTNLIDEWNNGEGQIDTNSIFCNDRSGTTDSNTNWSESMIDNGGTGSTATYYGSYLRLNKNKNPVFTCSTTKNKIADSFTYIEALTGTKSLTYPVGLITADEVVYAGGIWGKENRLYYLYTGQNYWTMSPSRYSSAAMVFYLEGRGQLADGSVSGILGLRPVINLKSSTQFTGDGTSTDPYVVQNS